MNNNKRKNFVDYILSLAEAERDEPSDENTDDEEIKNQAKFKKHKLPKTVEQMQRDR